MLVWNWFLNMIRFYYPWHLSDREVWRTWLAQHSKYSKVCLWLRTWPGNSNRCNINKCSNLACTEYGTCFPNLLLNLCWRKSILNSAIKHKQLQLKWSTCSGFSNQLQKVVQLQIKLFITILINLLETASRVILLAVKVL